MKRKKIIIGSFLVVIALLMVVSLSLFRSKRNRLLDYSDYYNLNKNQRTALLKSVTKPKELSETDQAIYSLMSAEVINGSRADSLLNISATYYSKVNDSLNLGLTYYLAGMNAQDKDNDLLSTSYLQRFMELYSKKDKIYGHGSMTLGFLYESIGNHQKAINNFQKCYKYYIQLKNYDKASFLLMFMNNEYLELTPARPDSTIYYSKLTIELMKKSKSPFLDSPYSSLSQAYRHLGDNKKALEYSNLSIAHMDKGVIYSRELINRAYIYYNLNQLDSAYILTNKIGKLSKHLDEKTKLLSMIYEKKGEYKLALEQQKLHLKYQESIIENRDRNLLDNLQFLIERNISNEEKWFYHSEAEDNKTKLFIGTIITISILSLLLYYYQWRFQKHKKDLQFKEIAQLNAEKSLEKQKREEAELREQFFKHLNLQTITSLEHGGRPFTSDEEWDSLLQNVDFAFGSFTTKLKNTFPLLNEEDIRYCCLIKMGLSQPEIATIMYREKSSVKKRIRRIALNKMNAEEGQRISEILQEI